VRAMVRDGSAAFIGSQSLRKIELDGRREIGLVVNDTRIARKMQEVFESDWVLAKGAGGSRKLKGARKAADRLTVAASA
jgi:cardiolipin synthase